MKFLCIDCDSVMEFAERQLPGDGTLAAVFACPSCKREMAMLTNPMETRFVSSMGIEIGGRVVPEQPMELVRSSLEGGREDAFADPPVAETVRTGAEVAAAEGWTASPSRGRVRWTPEATERLQRVPSFVRGMVKRIYTDWARERRIEEITPAVMDTARSELGLEGM